MIDCMAEMSNFKRLHTLFIACIMSALQLALYDAYIYNARLLATILCFTTWVSRHLKSKKILDDNAAVLPLIGHILLISSM